MVDRFHHSWSIHISSADEGVLDTDKGMSQSNSPTPSEGISSIDLNSITSMEKGYSKKNSFIF